MQDDNIDFRDDGLIAVKMDRLVERDGRQTVEATETVTLRRPTLDDLFSLWEKYDEYAEAAKAPLVEDGVEVEEPTAVQKRRKMFDTMNRNRSWYAAAFEKLAEGSIDGLATPVWWGQPTAANQMLSHWQDVPLVPGVQRALDVIQNNQTLQALQEAMNQ